MRHNQHQGMFRLTNGRAAIPGWGLRMENAEPAGRQHIHHIGRLASAQYVTYAENSSIAVAFEGELDISCRNFFRDVLARAEPYELVTVDLSNITYMDSMALDALVLVQRRRAAKAPLRIIISSTQVLRLFAIARLEQVFEILHLKQRRAG